MTFAAWIIAVCFCAKPGTDAVVRTGTDAEKGSFHLRQIGTLII